MYVRFYVLNRSKYRFPFHAVYIGIMTGIRKPTFHAARYNRQKYLGSDVRSRPLQTAPVRTEGLFWRPHGCNIAAGTAPVPEAVAEVFQSFQKKFFRRGFLLSPDNSELYLCPTNWHLSDKGPCSARPGVLPSRTPFEPILWILTEN